MRVQDAIEQAVAQTVAEHRETVAAWLAGTPKTWGLLAGQAIVACKRLVGRNLTAGERRLVWDRLWQRLQAEQRRD